MAVYTGRAFVANERRNITAGEEAMAYAMSFPEATERAVAGRNCQANLTFRPRPPGEPLVVKI
jgi:hypothetical protein